MQISAINPNFNLKTNNNIKQNYSFKGHYEEEDADGIDLNRMRDNYAKLKAVTKEEVNTTSPLGRFATTVLAVGSAAVLASKLSLKAINGIEKTLPLEKPLEKLGNKLDKFFKKSTVGDVTGFKTFCKATGAKLKNAIGEKLTALGKTGLKEGANASEIMVNGANRITSKALGLGTAATTLGIFTKDKDANGEADIFETAEKKANSGVVGFLDKADKIGEVAGAFLGAA